MLTTNPHTAERQKEKVFHFIDTVDAQIRRNEDMNAFRNSDVYKLNLSKKECERGKEECLRHIIQKFYRGATPLSDEYKDAKFNDLCGDIDKHCPKGLLFYFREAIRKGECGKRCQKMIEGVEQAVESSYKDKMIHPEKYNEEDLVFRMDPDMQAHMDLLSKDLELEDISDLVRRSVQSTTMSEVKRAKEEKERNQELEKELAAHKIASTSAESAIREINDRLANIHKESETRRAEVQQYEEEQAACNAMLEQLRLTFSDTQNALNGCGMKVQLRQKKLEEEKKKVEQSSARLSSLLSRQKMLEETERNMDGYQGSVKAVVREAEKGNLTGIHGPVSRLLSLRPSLVSPLTGMYLIFSPSFSISTTLVWSLAIRTFT